MHLPDFTREAELMKQGYTYVAGVDEAGAGCWAGPVVAGAVILRENHQHPLLRDSKTLSHAQRMEAAAWIKEHALAWAVGLASAQEIDAINIRQADFVAMRRAVESLSVATTFVLADGFLIPGLPMPCERVVRGDANILSIAAASIIAKTTRDAMMTEYDTEFPGYGFAQHKGYGTKQHAEALRVHGVTSIHRMTYRPIQQFKTPPSTEGVHV